MRPLVALVVKDIKLLVRDRTGLFFALVFPILMALFFGAIFSGDSDTGAIDAAVVDEDGSPESAALIEELGDTGALELTPIASRAEATQAVRTGGHTAYVIVPAGYAAARDAMFTRGGAVIVGVDPSRRAEAAMLSGIIARRVYAGFGSLFGDRGPPSVVDVEPVAREGKQPPSYFAISFPQGIAWGLMMCAMTFGLGLVSERSSGTLLRLRASPISKGHVLAGKAGACMVVVLVVQAMLFGIGAAMFDLEIGSLAALAMAALAAAICFVGVMMLLAVLGRTEKAASGYATGVMIVLMMLGGGMVPLMFTPGWMQLAGNVSPVKWALLALEGATWRDFTLAEMARPCLILVGFGAASFAAGAAAFRD